MEIWKDIVGYEGIYQISNLGNVFSCKIKRLKSLQMKRRDSRNGYYGISLYKKGKFKNFLIHRLVAIHFIENPENKPQVNHINGFGLDNNVSNLEWCTAKENNTHAINTGLKNAQGSGNGFSKLNEEMVIEIRSFKNLSVDYFADKFGLNRTTIWLARTRRSWKHVL